MRRIVSAVLLVAAAAASADAAPWSRRTVVRSSSELCTGDGCGGTVSERTRTVVRSTATAQGVAEIQAAAGAVGHHGGNTGYEGVGCGPTPEAALRACCSNGRPVIDQGTARGRDGRWYACKRYAR